MKKVTFPHMGTLAISLKSFLEEMGAEPIVPPPITKRTMELGVRHAPEFACLPLKVNLGNYLESVESGAEYILMAGGKGPCRFGYYSEVQREILYDLNQDIQMITIEPNIFSLYQTFSLLHGRYISPIRLYRILSFVVKKIRAVDDLERLVHYIRPRSDNPKKVNVKFRSLLKKMESAATLASVERVYREGEESLRELISDEEKDVLHVGIVGEIYQILEPYVSLNIEERLGEMGVQVHREMFLSHWLMDHALRRIDRQPYLDAAAPYLSSIVGGHGQETIGVAVLYAREGMDGVIQLAPFTCMPEIVAESILPLVSEKENIPILSLFFDEHSGAAGTQTRIEAFVDLIRRNSYRRVRKHAGLSRN